MKKYIAYYRVSTQRQGMSGLGLESQKNIIDDYLIGKGIILNSYTEIESGKNDNRPQLKLAIEECTTKGAVLIVAKLDRLARSVYFISSLQQSKIDFICCDFPEANKLTITLIAAIAEYERDLISTRTKSALKVLKDKGVKLGAPNANWDDDTRSKGLKVRQQNSLNNENNKRALAFINANKDRMTLTQLSEMLNENGFKTSRGKSFRPSTIYQMINK